MRDQGGNFQVYGVGGVNLHQLWGEEPAVYYGITVSQFPNFLSMFGPNAGAP
jgi:cation diffusion facilitator CzcD-associated flavoprotein CzcO